jgi:hypothetical protein
MEEQNRCFRLVRRARCGWTGLAESAERERQRDRGRRVTREQSPQQGPGSARTGRQRRSAQPIRVFTKQDSTSSHETKKAQQEQQALEKGKDRERERKKGHEEDR